MKTVAHYFLALIICGSCASVKNSAKYQLGNGVYDFTQNDTTYHKAYVYVSGDTVRVYRKDKPYDAIIPAADKDQIYLKSSFDVDAMTIAFKYRPGSFYLPRQLTADFNGNIFFGYRLDRFQARLIRTPFGAQKIQRHRAITTGVFGGIGSTSVTPWTTFNHITDEYNGLIITRGLALMLGINNLTVGAGVGWDYLTDRDKDVWIYQNKSWYGLTIGLNIN
jgi:hypothetical protein